MARPLRIEYAGALYHVTSRGDRQENIYESDDDRDNFLLILAEVCQQYNWSIHSYCLMSITITCWWKHPMAIYLKACVS